MFIIRRLYLYHKSWSKFYRNATKGQDLVSLKNESNVIGYCRNGRREVTEEIRDHIIEYIDQLFK